MARPAWIALMAEYLIDLPGSFEVGVAFVDVETEKVLTPLGFTMPSGEPLRRRWAVTLAAVARDGSVVLLDPEGQGEEEVLNGLHVWLYGARSVFYGGTRQFDEMVLRGRFANARRAHLPQPTWPAVPGAEGLPWVNIGPEHSGVPRDEDVESRLVPQVLRSGGEGWNRCAIHCLRDALDLVLRAGHPDDICRAWIERFLADYHWAWEVFTSERTQGLR